MPSNLRRAQDEYAELQPGLRSGSVLYAATVEEAVRCADMVIDFVPDELESKLEIFSMVDRMAPPRTILCTPTRALSITDLASCTYRPGLCVGVRGPLDAVSVGVFHELLRSRFADEIALIAVSDFFARLGTPVQIVEDVEEPMLVKNSCRPQI
jgi:3-hydroxybutyryl-CoA dehydrogenase